MKKVVLAYVAVVLLKVLFLRFSFVFPDSPTYWAEAVGALNTPFPHMVFAKLLGLAAKLPLALDLRLLAAELLNVALTTTALFPAYFFLKKHRPSEALLLAAILQFFPPFMFSNLLMREGLAHALIAWAVWLYSEGKKAESAGLLVAATAVKITFFPLVLAAILDEGLKRFSPKMLVLGLLVVGIVLYAVVDLYIPEYKLDRVVSDEVLSYLLDLLKILVFLISTIIYVSIATLGFTLPSKGELLRLGILMILLSLPFNWAYQSTVKFTYGVDIESSSLYYGRYLEGALIPFYFLVFSSRVRANNFISFLAAGFLTLLLFGIDFSANPSTYLVLWMNSIWFALLAGSLLLKALSLQDDLLFKTVLALLVAATFVGENSTPEVPLGYDSNPKVIAFMRAEGVGIEEGNHSAFGMMRTFSGIVERRAAFQNNCFVNFKAEVDGQERVLKFKEVLEVSEGQNITYRLISPLECNYFLPTATLVGLFPMNVSN